MSGEGYATVAGGPSPPRHFPLLDGTRGVAAVAVLLHHVGNATGVPIMPHGFLAVDYFLLLSGFVIALSYERRLGSGLSVEAFLWLRVLRLWPMIVAGGVLATLGWTLGAENGAVPRQAIALQFLLLPMPVGLLLFPLNPPLWSLLYELIANLLHALGLRRMGVAALVGMLVGLAAIDLAILIGVRTWSLGYDPHHFGMALARILTGYGLGVLLFRLHAAGRLPRLAAPWWLPLLLILAPMALPASVSEGPAALLAVALCFPLALTLGLTVTPGGRLAKAAGWIGGLSYPLYATHLPILRLWTRTGWLAPEAPHRGLAWAAAAASAILAAWAFERWYDAPIRMWLRRRTEDAGAMRLSRI